MPAQQIPTANGAAPAPALTPTPPATPAISFDSDEVLYKALTSRTGDKAPGEITLTDAEREAIVTHVIQEFEDADASNRQFKENMTRMTENWRGVADEKDFPFEGASNLRVPLTSVYVEQMKARLLKAIFGGELWSKMEYIERQVQAEALKEANQWWDFELRKIVKLKAAVRDIIHDVLVVGTSMSIPSYHHETRFLHSFKEWAFDDSQPLQLLIQQGIEEILGERSEWGADSKIEIGKQTKPGEFQLIDPDPTHKTDKGRIVFSLDIDKLRLRADIWKREVTFDGARINYVAMEDLVVANTDPDIEKIPFFGVRLFFSLNDYRQKLEDGYFIDYGEEENARIIAGSDMKIGQFIGQQTTDLQDAETGTDSKDTVSSLPTHKFLEAYRWEGWWAWDKSGEGYDYDKILQPATQICAWVEPKSKALLKIARLEDLNKDGKRSGVKFGFIHEPGRLFDMGLAEWVRHMQTLIDAIDNLRIDSGLLTNVPSGLYKPTAGLKGPIRMEPGVWYPSSDPQSLFAFPHNFNPSFGYQEELLQRRYADMQAGLSDSSMGHAPSKRQSATEVVSTASALDLRTEDILERFLESLTELLTRVFGLYQQFGPEERIFRAGGEKGVQLTKRFERDRMQGQIEITCCGDLTQINEQLQREIAMDMLQLLLNQILMQSGIVGADTIHAAVKLIAKLYHYNEVPLHQPQMPPQSDAPEVEERQMFAGQKPIGPTMSENTDEHLQHHAMLAADKKTMDGWTPAAQQLLGEHIRATIQMKDAIVMMNQQRAALGAQMAMEMQKRGLSPNGQKPSDQTGPGTQAEGVGGAASSPTAPNPGQK